MAHVLIMKTDGGVFKAEGKKGKRRIKLSSDDAFLLVGATQKLGRFRCFSYQSGGKPIAIQYHD